MENKYLKLHSLLRMAAALIALITFISMFITKQVVHSEYPNDVFLMWNEAFFDDVDTKGTVLGFIGYLFVLFGGLAGLAFVFIDELIGKDLTKKLSFIAAGVIAVGAVMMLLTGVLYRGMNSDGLGIKYFVLGAGPIVFAILSFVAAACNAAAPILEDKGL
jgi:uncharacterized membrane protein